MSERQEVLISVLMGVYNETEKELDLCVSSILNQTWNNIELIVVVDNPERKDLVKYIKEQRNYDARIVLLVNNRNMGIAKSITRAFEISKGHYIARMDADDICVPDRFMREVNFLKKEDGDIVSGNCFYISEDGEQLGCGGKLPHGENIKRLIMYSNFVKQPTVLMKRDVFEALGGYRQYPMSEDYDMWLRAVSSGFKFAVLDEPLIYYRIRENSLSKKNEYKAFLLKKFMQLNYRERLETNGEDSYSEEVVNDYIEGVYSEKKAIKFNKAAAVYRDACVSANIGKYVQGIWLLAKSFFLSRDYAAVIWNNIIYKLRK